MTSTRVTNILSRFSSVFNKSLQETSSAPCVFSNHEQRRGRRRRQANPIWFVKEIPKEHNERITKENKEFIQDVLQDTYKTTASPLRDEPWERQPHTNKTIRTGVLAMKIGVFPQWTVDGQKFHTTLLQVLDNHVVRYTPPEKACESAGWKPWWYQKYGVVVVGALSCDPSKFAKEYNNLFAEAGIPPKRKLTRFLVTDNAKVQPGTPLSAMHFRVGDFVDCQSKTIDHGFQGVVKRWGMKGMPATHGTTKSHRRMGAIGGGGDKGGIWKGKKMPGHMGSDWNTLKGLRIWRINTKYNILYVNGPCVPGECHAYVRVMDTCLPLRKPESAPPMPTWFPEDATESLDEDIFHEKLFQFSKPSIEFEEESK